MALRAQLDPALLASYATSGARIARRRVLGPRRFGGDAAAICRASVDACWTGRSLAASGGHFRQAWARDLGFAAPSLVRLGSGDRLAASLGWMLAAWSRAGRVTTTIFPGPRPRDVWTLGVDSLPLLVHSMRALSVHDPVAADRLVGAHASWLAPEIVRYAGEVLDPETALVRDDRDFSSHRDTVRTRSNAYANTMVALLDRHLRETGWFTSPIPLGATERLVRGFWRGDRWVDRPDTGEITGDATVVPFFFEVVPDSLGLGAALATAVAAGLTDPLPLRYTARRDADAQDPVQRWLVPDYQGTAVWTSLGAMYVRLLQRADPVAARPVVDAYRARIEVDGTVWEVFDGHARDVAGLRPYAGRLGLFLADEAMLWAAIFAEAFEAARPGPVPGVDDTARSGSAAP